MEDNNNNNIVNERKNICFENHCWKKCLAMIFAAFLGGFLAFYFVADQTMKEIHTRHMYKPHRFEQKMFNDVERMYRQDMKAFDDMFNKHHKKHILNMPFFSMDSVKIKTEYNDNKFNIMVDLKPFQGSDDKINYITDGRKITVFGKSIVKEEGFEQDIAFSQDFILPKNADTSNITREKDGNKLVISIPIKQ